MNGLAGERGKCVDESVHRLQTSGDNRFRTTIARQASIAMVYAKSRLNHHFVATGGNSVVHNAVSGTDFLVYHAIVVPPHGGCPRLDPEYARPVKMVPIDGPAPNPYCRVQGERQAMIDPLAWARGADGVEWPLLKNGTGTPSVGRTPMP